MNLSGIVNNSAGNPTAINIICALRQTTEFFLGSGTRIDMNADIPGTSGISKTGAVSLCLQTIPKTYNGDR